MTDRPSPHLLPSPTLWGRGERGTIPLLSLLLATSPALAQESPAPPAPVPSPPAGEATRPLGPGDPLPRLDFNHYGSITGSLPGVGRISSETPWVAEGNVVCIWGDLRLNAERLEYDPKVGRVYATGGVRLVRGDERVETSSLIIDLQTGTMTAEGAVVASPPFYISGARIERSAGVLTATDALVSTYPEGHSEFSITASRVVVDTNDDDLLLQNASLRLFGTRVLTIRSWRIPLPSGRTDRQDISTLPLTVRSSRISGVAIGLTPTFRIAERTDLATQVFLPTRRTLQYSATVRRSLLPPRLSQAPPLPPRPGAPGGALAAELNGAPQNSDGTGESPLRRLLRARSLPKPDPVLDFESILSRAPGNVSLTPPGQTVGMGLDAELTLSSNQEIANKRQGLAQLSRRPEARLFGRLPLGGAPIPRTSDDDALRHYLRHPRLVLTGDVSAGEYRERRLGQDRATVTYSRAAATVGIGTLPVLIGDRLLVRPQVTATQFWYEGGAHYSFAELNLSAEYVLGTRTSIGAAFIGRGIDGDTPFIFDEIDTQNEAQFRAQAKIGRHTIAGLARYDVRQGTLFDYEIAFALRTRSLEPRFSYRRLGGQFGFGLAIPGITTF